MGSRGPVPNPNRPLRKRRTATSAELARAPWIDAADHPILKRLLLIYRELEAFRSIVERDGPVTAGSKGQMIAHPLLAVIDRSRASADVLERELGLTPMARQRMHITIEAPLARPSQPVPAEPYARLRGLA